MPARIHLRRPGADDREAFIAAAGRSRTLHGAWVSPPLTPAAYDQYVERMAGDAHVPFLVCRRDGGALVGVVNLTNIVRGAFRSGYLGWYAFTGHERQGLMREGLDAVVRHAWARLRLHRLEANIQPGNEASKALARACGFTLEGYSPRYLKIRGRWRDHERWAILADTRKP